MNDSAPRQRPDVMGVPDEPADVMEGGKEPAGESPDVLAPGSQAREEVLKRGREPAGEDPGMLDNRER